MRIALVSGSAGDTKCGVGDYTYELAQHLSLDAEVTLYHAKGFGPKNPPFEKLTSLQIRELSGFSAITIAFLAKRLASEGYDILHIQYPSKGFGNSVGPGFLPQRLSGMQSRSRIVVTLHEWLTSHPLRKMVMDQMLPSLDALVVSNEREMDALVHKVAGKTVTVIPVGNTMTSRNLLEAVWLEHEGKPVPAPKPPAGMGGREQYSLFHYGLLASSKGINRLLEALGIVREAGIPAVLYLAGEFNDGNKLAEDILGAITRYQVVDAVRRIGHLPVAEIARQAELCWLGVFPFDEGYSSKRSSIAGICHLDLPIVVGGGAEEEHPFYAPQQNTAADLAVLLVELMKGRLEQEWTGQVSRQREYGERFNFAKIAHQHLDLYKRLRNQDV